MEALADARTFAGSRPRSLAGWLGREGLLVAIGAVFLLFWTLAAPFWIQPDSWLTLLGGREIVAHGIPRHDDLAAMTHGYAWVDQQWLAQLAFYGLAALGGIRLALLTSIGMLLGALVLALVLARRRGASATSIAPFALLPGLYFTSPLRAQLFSQVLFVVMLGLLAAQSRRRSRLVFLAFPLLVLWANLHGAAVVGAGLVALLGACELVRRPREWPRPLALLAGPWLCLLATPYGTATLSYYHSTLGNPLFRQSSTEWMPPTLTSVTGFAFFPLAAAAVALVARRPRDLTGFELAALALTLVGGLTAVRSAPWFAYSCLVLLPGLLERSRRRRAEAESPTRLRVGFAAATASVALVALAVTALEPEARLTRNWPDRAAASIAREPQARVFASHQFADWLLYVDPSLRGRVAFDGRWELLTQAQMRSVLDYLWQVGPGWERPSRGYGVLVLDPQTEKRLVDTYAGRPGTRVLYRDDRVVVFDRRLAQHAREGVSFDPAPRAEGARRHTRRLG